MAEKLNLDANYYATVERGEKQFSLSTFITVLETLDVSANELIPYSLKKRPDNGAKYKKQVSEIIDNFSEAQYIAAIKVLKAIDEMN
jgi:transcriptional regulator with XRE-family HTH domain